MNVQSFLSDRDVRYDVISHPATYDAQRLAHAIHVSGRDLAKTVLLRADRGFLHLVAVLPAAQVVDLTRVSEILGGAQIELATEMDIIEHCPDCEIGALPPFGSFYGLKTIVDQSLTADEEIVFEGNNHQEAIRMRFDDFRRLEEPLIAAITQAT